MSAVCLGQCFQLFTHLLCLRITLLGWSLTQKCQTRLKKFTRENNVAHSSRGSVKKKIKFYSVVVQFDSWGLNHKTLYVRNQFCLFLVFMGNSFLTDVSCLPRLMLSAVHSSIMSQDHYTWVVNSLTHKYQTQLKRLTRENNVTYF